ncbi:hypothetical protein M422DRAFT_240339 [Sphaerobolus stellatus SS14]|nr:hypothetical protein M422DRAFT_240339 [Sphaerobolus stellatus SS14]
MFVIPTRSSFFDAAIAIKCFGVSISYSIIVKSLMFNVVASIYHDLLPGDPPAWAMNGRLWITLCMAALIPLSFLRKLNSLRDASYIAVSVTGLQAARPVLKLTDVDIIGLN